MALATTCPQCKTSFKVIPDQLKLRRGLVRCGVCQHVFSGVEHLRYVDKDEDTEKVQPSVATTAQVGSAPLAGATPVGALGGYDPGQADSLDTLPGPVAGTMPDDAALPSSLTFPPLEAAGGTSATPAPDTRTDPQPPPGPAPVIQQPQPSVPPGNKAGTEPPQGKGRNRRRGRNRANQERAAAPPPAREDDNLNTVFFMADHEDANAPDDVHLPDSLRADHRTSQPGDDLDPDTMAAGKLVNEANRIWRQQKSRTELERGNRSPGTHTRNSDKAPASDLARWLAPRHRRWLGIALAVLAAVQLLAVFRTEIAYRLPFLRPLASLASTLTGQVIQPPMSLATLSIESFELRGTPQPGQTRLTAILRNRSNLPARWPAMELTLTGPSNTVLVRKVLLPRHYLPAAQKAHRGIAANTEFPLDLVLETQDLNLAGYSVALFYPFP